MTRESVINGLRTSPFFWIEFILDNNPEAVMSRLSGIGLLPGTPDTVTRSQLFDALVKLPDHKLKEALEVPYNNNATNYTGTLEPELTEGFYLNDDTRSENSAGLLVGSIVGGILNLGNGFFGWKTSQEQAGIAATNQQTALLMAQEADKRRIFGMEPIVFSVVAIVVGAIIITAIVALSKRKK